MAFNEDSRVKIPALLHLKKLGFQYVPQKEQIRLEDTNIFEDLFVDSISRINPEVSKEDILRLLEDISLELDYEDLGKKFY